MNWRVCRLGDVLTLKRGHDLPDGVRQDGDVPVVSSSGITGYHNEACAKAPGVVTGRYGTLGQVFFVEQDYWPLNTALYVTDFKGSDPRFTAYLLRHTLRGFQTDKAAVPGVNRNVLHDLEVRVPDRTSQERISDLLSAYDDLIENNRRRMELLEDTARHLYREWFVRLKFPGSEHTPVRNGAPEGWEQKRLAELCESIDYGYTASADQEEIGPKFLRPDVIDWCAVPYCFIPDERLQKFQLREGDIVVARTGATVGYAKRLNKRHPDAVFASYLVRLRLSSEVDNLMIGVFVESDAYRSFVRSRVGGAAQPNANARALSEAEILVPTHRLQRAFHELAEPLLDLRETLQAQNERLRAARDLLLPRLMSGEIEV